MPLKFKPTEDENEKFAQSQAKIWLRSGHCERINQNVEARVILSINGEEHSLYIFDFTKENLHESNRVSYVLLDESNVLIGCGEIFGFASLEFEDSEQRSIQDRFSFIAALSTFFKEYVQPDYLQVDDNFVSMVHPPWEIRKHLTVYQLTSLLWFSTEWPGCHSIPGL